MIDNISDWMGRNCSIHAGGCDFDYDLCGYETTPIVDYTWKSMSGRTPTLTTGPEGDHTTGQGRNFYILSYQATSFIDSLYFTLLKYLIN